MEDIRSSLFESYIYFVKKSTMMLKVASRTEPFTCVYQIYMNRYKYYYDLSNKLYSEYSKFKY